METETHTRIARKAIEQIAGKELEQYKAEFLKGAFYEDYWKVYKLMIGLPVLSHFYSPEKNRGLLFFRTAKSHGVKLFNKALKFYKLNNKPKAFFYLGRAVHLIADMATPAHTNLSYHFFKPDKFEQYALTRHLPDDTITIESKEIVDDYYEELANISCKYPVFRGDLTLKERKELVTQFYDLTRLAIGYSIALILHFIKEVKK